MKKNKIPANLQHWIETSQSRILNQLPNLLPSNKSKPQDFNRALHYVMGNGGKRMRPMLVYITNDMFGGKIEDADNAAMAVELIHTYSLVHDDLPAMDDDDLRRGQPSCHCAFDEATAILVGDALQSMAFEVLSKPSSLSANTQLKMVHTLAVASGAFGMCGGQALDMEATNQALNLDALKHLHQLKTGALIKASILLGAYASQKATEDDLKTLEQYAEHVGLAFQVQDDVLDVVGDTEQLGKPQGSDSEQGKTTYPNLLGLEKASQYAKQLCEQSKQFLQSLEYNSSPLCNLADYINQRVA